MARAREARFSSRGLLEGPPVGSREAPARVSPAEEPWSPPRRGVGWGGVRFHVPWLALGEGLDEVVKARRGRALRRHNNRVVLNFVRDELVLPLGLEVLVLQDARVVDRCSCRARHGGAMCPRVSGVGRGVTGDLALPTKEGRSGIRAFLFPLERKLLVDGAGVVEAEACLRVPCPDRITTSLPPRPCGDSILIRGISPQNWKRGGARERRENVSFPSRLSFLLLLLARLSVWGRTSLNKGGGFGSVQLTVLTAVIPLMKSVSFPQPISFLVS